MVEKVLNQEQIDAMVRAARGGGATSPQARQKNVSPWDVRQAGQIGREQMRSITSLHEGFARNLTHSLGAYLRTGFAANLVSAEHLTYGEFLQRIPEVTYLASCVLHPVGESALLQLDLAAAFPLIDVLLGGEGKAAAPSREITEIEEQILESVMRIICREIQSAWLALAVEFQFAQRQQAEQAARLMPSEEKTLSLSFEITVMENRGTLNIVVPAVVSNALLRKLAAGYAVKPRAHIDFSPQLRARLRNAVFSTELAMDAVRVPLQELRQLSPGGLLLLAKRVGEPAQLRVSGQALFRARVVRQGNQRAAQLLERIVVEETPQRVQEGRAPA
jgi:flagellar motor switch protein FliM